MATGHLAELHNGIVTSWLPLTTPAPSPYPSSCLSGFRLETISSTVTNIVAFDPWYGQAIDTNYRNCLPAEQTAWWAQEKAPATTLNIGPFACPTPYTTATVSSQAPGTTLIACCPSGYDYQGTILPPLSGRQCFSSLSSGQVITAKTGSIGPNNWSETTATITATDVGVYGNQLNGYIFGNETAVPTPVENSIQTAGATATTGSTHLPALNSGTGVPETSTHASTSGTLSNGAKIGIGIGVSVGAVIICGFITVIWILRRRLAVTNNTMPPMQEPVPDFRPLPPPPPPPLQELSSEKEHCEVEANERPPKIEPVEMWA